MVIIRRKLKFYKPLSAGPAKIPIIDIKRTQRAHTKKLDEGKSISSIARQEGIAEGAIRYHIKQGSLKKKSELQQATIIGEKAATPNERNQQDQQSPLGIATTRYEQRTAAMMYSPGRKNHGNSTND